ncbi:MAG TPA: DUF3108 domain-containing protein, partial [bacterium]|nr:DUF3108 domain-containing protein [bacterium]
MLAAFVLVATAAAALPPDLSAVTTPAGPVPLPMVIPADAATEPETPFGPPESLAPPPPPRPELPETLPFGPGERLTFSIDYGIINAGWAVMEIPGTRRYVGVECLDIRTEANSNAFFSKVHKVRDRAGTFLDPGSVLPLRFEKHQREGSYKKDIIIRFDRDVVYAGYENGDRIAMSPWAQDELSAFYYLRTLPLEVGRDVF